MVRCTKSIPDCHPGSLNHMVCLVINQMRESLMRILRCIIHPVLALRDYPVLFRAGDFIFVTTGVINSLAAVLSYLCAFFLYCRIFPGETAENTFAWNLAMVSVVSLAFSKGFHYFALGKVFFRNPKKYLAETAFYNQGGQLGVLFGTMWLAWITGINFFGCMDINLTAGCLALALGRLGCYSYGCCHGRPTNSRFGVAYDHPDTKVLRLFPDLKGIPLVPTQLISALVAFALFITALLWLTGFSPPAGIVSTFLIFAYNGFRLLIERYRINVVDVESKRLRNGFYIRVAQFIIGIGVVYALVLWWFRMPRLSLTTSPWPDADTGVNLITPEYVEVSLALFIVYMLVWGVHYKKLGQHFQWRRT